MEYKQYVTEHMTEVGTIKITSTFESENGKDWALDEKSISVNGNDFHCPKAWYTQTSTTVIRKVCAVKKGQ